MIRTLLAIVMLVCAMPAQAQRELPEGFAIHPRPGRLNDVVAMACSREHAYLRGWMGNVVRWNGAAAPTELTAPTHPAYGRELWVSPDEHVFITATGRVAEWDGSAWSDHPMPEVAGELGAMWGVDARTYFVAARASVIAPQNGALVRFDAGTWRDLYAVWGIDERTMFLAGQGGTIMRRVGARFVRERTETDASIRGLFGTSGVDVFAWGEASRVRVILHYDGRTWTRAEEGLPEGAIGAIGGAANAVYAVGEFGIARWRDGRWSVVVPFAAIDDDVYSLNGVCATARQIVIADSGGFVITGPR